jgi:hypothetical protein
MMVKDKLLFYPDLIKIQRGFLKKKVKSGSLENISTRVVSVNSFPIKDRRYLDLLIHKTFKV